MFQPHPDMDNEDVLTIAAQILDDQGYFEGQFYFPSYQEILSECGWFDEPAWSEWMEARMSAINKRIQDRDKKE